MAESLREKVVENNVTRIVNENPVNVECAVCLQTCIHPAELPCGHVFCYLCIKGIVNQGRRCAMCRQDIPVDYLDKPRLLKPVDAENTGVGFEDGHLWFYEGHNGWWQYDERTSLELESAYQKGERCCELLIAGFLYVADFDAMLQYRMYDPCRRRRIKRDLATITKKGVAGLKATKECNETSLSSPDLVTNLLIPDLQSLHISGQPVINHSNDSRPLLSVPSSSGQQQSDSVQVEHLPRDRNLPLTSPRSINNLNPRRNSNLNSQTESDDTFYSRNLELDSIIHDTLDWTIEQIESLNLELTNDYENLFRDVDNYGQLHDILGRNRSSSLAYDPVSQFSNPANRLNRSLENQLDSTDTTSNFLRLNRSEGNVSSQCSRTPSHEITQTSNTPLSERLSTRSMVLANTASTSQPFRGNRIPRFRFRRVSPRRSSSLRDNDA